MRQSHKPRILKLNHPVPDDSYPRVNPENDHSASPGATATIFRAMTSAILSCPFFPGCSLSRTVFANISALSSKHGNSPETLCRSISSAAQIPAASLTTET